MSIFVIREPTHRTLLQPGQLYRVDAPAGDVVVGWSEPSFVPEWNDHLGGFKEALENIQSDALAISNMGLVLYCGAKRGFTVRDGNGIYFRFLYKEKVVYFSEERIARFLFCTLHDDEQ